MIRLATAALLVAGLSAAFSQGIAEEARTGATALAESWYPSRHGPEDTIGAANFVTPERVRDAAQLVSTGRVYSLGLRIDSSVSHRSYRTYSVTVVQPGNTTGHGVGSNRLTVNDDLVQAWQGIGTQIDGLAHAGIDNVFYNGLRAEQFVSVDGVRRLDVASIPPLVGRGVVLDFPGLLGVAHLDAGTAIDQRMIEAASQRQGIVLQQGDIVLLHTGWMSVAPALAAGGVLRSPGLGLDGARFLAKLGVVAVGSDTFAVEVWPAEDPMHVAPVHQELLARHGVYMLENVVTRELVADAAWEFLFVLSAPRLVGAVQAVINPVAIR